MFLSASHNLYKRSSPISNLCRLTGVGKDPYSDLSRKAIQNGSRRHSSAQGKSLDFSTSFEFQDTQL